MTSSWIEDNDAKSFLKQVKDLRDDVSIAKDELPLRLQDAAIENPQLFVKLVDEMIATYENKNANHRELPLAERMAQSSKKYSKLPAKLRRRRNSSKKSMGRRSDSSDTASLGSLSKYDSHDTISYSISDDEASHTSKSLLSIGADADAVEIEFALDESASQSSNVSYASRVAKMIRKLRKRFSDNESEASELTQDFDEMYIMKSHNPRKVEMAQSHESGLNNTMSDPQDAKMTRTKQRNDQSTSYSHVTNKTTRLNRGDRSEMGSKSFPPLQPAKTPTSKEKVSMFRRLFKTKKKKTYEMRKNELPLEIPKFPKVPVHVAPTDAFIKSRQSPGVQKKHLQQRVPKSHSQQALLNQPFPGNGKGQSPDALSMNIQVTPCSSTQPPIQQNSRVNADVSLLVAGSSISANKSFVRESFGIDASISSEKTHPSIPDIVRSFDGDEESYDEGITDVIDDNSHANTNYQASNRRTSKNQIQRKGKPDPPTFNENKFRSESMVLGERTTHENRKVPVLGETMAHGNRTIREENTDQFGLQIYSPKRSNSPQDLKLLVPKTKDPVTRELLDLERPVAKKNQSATDPHDLKRLVTRKKDPPQNHLYRASMQKKYPIEEWRTALRSEEMRKQSKSKKSVKVRSPRRRSHRSEFDDEKSMSSLSFLTNFLDDLDDSLNDAIDRNEAIKTLFDSYEKMIASRKMAKKKSRKEYERKKKRSSLQQTSSQDISIGSVASFDMLDPF